MKLFLNIIKFVVVILILYIGLNIYVKSKKEKVNQQNLLYLTTVSLNEGQMAIASYIINKKREYEFNNYFFLIHDAFTSNNKIALVAASTYLNDFKSDDFKKQLSINRNIIELATKRYIIKKIIVKFVIIISFQDFTLEMENMVLLMLQNFTIIRNIVNYQKKNLLVYAYY